MSRSIESSAGTATLQIHCMTCASCVARVEKAIRSVPGVASANVNLATDRASVNFTGKPDPAGVIVAIEKAGHSTRQDTLELQIDGMTCASCAARIEKGVMLVPGLVTASVNLGMEKAAIKYVTGATSPLPGRVWPVPAQRGNSGPCYSALDASGI
jgi:Cu+-exporting ATPase